MVAALIFDVDGTLADTENNGHRPAFNEAFEKSGLDDRWSEADYHALLKVAGGKERLRHYFLSLGRPEAHDAELIRRLHRLKTAAYGRMVREGQLALRPGVQALIASGRDRDLRLAIATTTTRSNVETLLQACLNADAASWFEVIACADDAPVKKPAPDVYRFVLDKMQLSASDVIVFEDNRNGLSAALGAGICRVVITPTAFSRGENFDEAWQLLDDLTQFELPS